MSDLALYVASSALLKHLLSSRACNSQQEGGMPSNAKRIGTVKGVYIYPVKSGRGIELQDSVMCTDYGLQYQGAMDRQWMVMNMKTQGPLSGRECPKLVRIQTSIQQDSIQLDCDGLPTLTLPSHVPKDSTVHKVSFYGEVCEAVDCGDEAAEWVRRAVESPDAPYRLVFHPTHLQTRRCQDGETIWQRQANPKAKVQFQDILSYMLLTSASVRDINNRVSRKHGRKYDVPAMQFRPNVEIDGKHIQPYAEDRWREVYIGTAVRFIPTKPCDRCRFSTVNAETGETDKRLEPLKTIREFRPKIGPYNFGPFRNIISHVFGMNCVVDRVGEIQVGDPVYAVSW